MSLLNGKYLLEQRLGGGGMAEVFLARTVGAEGFSRQVAIKRVLPGYSENPHFARMFVSEAQLSSRLQHPNVVSVLDFDRDADGRLFLVMELVEGTDLDGLVQTGFLPFPALIFIISEVLRGLGYAHDLPAGADGVRGLVHRDVSPHNVLLSWEGAVKVSDFGIAKARAASNATATEMIKGKPAYMSPEQASGEGLDGRSDLFAVGVMLWEMLCGRMLFAGESTQETLARLLFAPIPNPRQLRPDVPPDLDRITMKLLSRDRNQRYANANAALADLIACRDQPRSGRELLVSLLEQRFTGRAPVRTRGLADSGIVSAAELQATPSAPVSMAKLPGPTAAALSAQTAAAVGHRSHRRGLLWAGLAVGVAAVAAVAIVLATSGREPTAAEVVEATATPATPTPTPTPQPPPQPPHVEVNHPVGSGSDSAIAAPTPAAGTRTSPIQETPPKRRTSSGTDAKRTSSTGMREVQLGGN